MNVPRSGARPREAKVEKRGERSMAKIIMTLVIPDPKVRKPQAKAVQKHKDKTKYTRKVKHKAPEWGPCATKTRAPSINTQARSHVSGKTAHC